ncbi:MAG: mechanosensitive ion channel [Lachnospiraceae bacterium]|nr:mechanosensitive ion channel [Lachnospiraceae bacterium]
MLLLNADTQEVIKEANVLLETIEGYIPKLIGFGVNVLIALLIFFVGKIIISLVLKLVGKLMKRANIDESVTKFLDSVLKVVMYIILLIIICSKIGIETTSIIAIFTSASLAVGLALQGALSNFAGGVMILLMRPFKVGDYISANGVEGVVERIDLFYTRLVTVDNKLVLVPNGEVTSAKLTNVTAFDTRRVDLNFSIGYGEDIDKARAVIASTIARCETALHVPEDAILVSELGNSGVVIQTRTWTKTADYWTTYFFIQENVKKALDSNKINIPYNQIDVHIVEK